LALLKRHGFDLLCIFLFFLQTRETRRAAAPAARATKNPARHAARAPGVVSVNIFFWKILVTRVKRKIELPLSPSISSGQRHAQGEVSPLNTGFALLRCMSPVMAQSGHTDMSALCPLSGVKRT
jgi:hypothetical protein